ncbi:MAG: extracellular solute-binding protein [Kutzneria sp.]|nr:extracellular solute-binding protein [Kutzneria sp.]MBV9844015.1 extracellular solute-binding protein [Kutzneria sp.]
MRTATAMALTAFVGASLVGCGGPAGKDAKNVTLTIAANAITGGKNAAEANWLTDYVIPRFVAAEKAKGVTAKVVFQPSGVDDEQYKTKLSLDLKARSGADVIDIDSIWIGEFAQAGYVKPLSELPGKAAEDWDGWKQMSSAAQDLVRFDDKRYAVPIGIDGRVLYYNKALFAKAGLGTDWQPKSWQEILDAGRKLKTLPGVTPIQLDAGTAMGEATTTQGVLPILAGAGAPLYAGGKWTGATAGMKDTLGLYRDIYQGGLGEPALQQEAKGRDKSFQEFADGKIGILGESDYFWRSVINPKGGTAPMADRDTAVGYALIPAQAPGKGLRGSDFVSYSGGSVRIINRNTKYPDQAFDLLAFMNSADAVKAGVDGAPKITARTDVNDEVLGGDPMLKFVADRVLAVTSFRPPLAVYPRVSLALQEATAAVVAGRSPDDAATAYQATLAEIVGGAANIAS